MPGLIAVTQSTQGSVENVTAVTNGTLDMALSQADITYFAYFGLGNFDGAPPMHNLRVIANLFQESFHVVVRADSGITSITDLKGKRVSLGQLESGTRVGTEMILTAYGLTPDDVAPFYESVGRASDMLEAGDLDAYFMVGGTPIHAVAHLADQTAITLLPITGDPAKRIVAEHPFFAMTSIGADTYAGVGVTETLGVGAQWITSSAMDDELVYGVTRALWHENTRKMLDSGHPEGRRIRLDTALDGIGIPLHPGASRFYEEAGIKNPGTL